MADTSDKEDNKKKGPLPEEQSSTFVTNPEENPVLYAHVRQPDTEKTEIVEVVENPALNILDNLHSEGEITAAKAAYLKNKYLQMKKILTESSNNISKLQDECSNYGSSHQKLVRKLEEANRYPSNVPLTMEATNLRESVLNANNKYAEVRERILHYEFKIECLTQEKAMLERDFTKQPKPGEMRSKLKELQKYVEDTKKEIYQSRLDVKHFQEEKAESNQKQKQENKGYDLLKEKMENSTMELYHIVSIPNQIAKEGDKISRKIQVVEKEKMVLKLEYDECFETVTYLENISLERDKEKHILMENIDKTYAIKVELERKLAAMKSTLEQTKDRLAQKFTEKDELEISIHHTLNEKQRRQEYITIISRNIDKEQRDLKKSELQAKIAKDNLNHLEHILNKISQKKVTPADNENRTKKIEDLKQENEVKAYHLGVQNRNMATQNTKFDESIEVEQMLLQEYFEVDLELQELYRFAALKTTERDKKARDKNRAENRYRCIKEELKSKYSIIVEHRKKLKQKKKRLKTFAEKYEEIKTDRNKYVTLIQSSTQKTSELRQKIKIIQNEMEILRTAVVLKDKQLHKERLKHMQNVLLRDALREDIDKHHRKVIELEGECEQQKIEIKKFNYMINQAEDHMIKLRKRYENAIQERNKKGEWLIKINSEVCLFYEKFNVQNEMITKGNTEIENFDQEFKILNLEKTSLLREINVLNRQLPERNPLKEQLRIVKLDFEEWETRCKKMSKSVVERDDNKFTRFLEGDDPSPPEQAQKIEQLEIRLAGVEKQQMEKELLSKQITHLLDRLKHKIQTGKEDTLKLAKNINDIQHKIKETTRKIMSLTAELSMNQANAIMSQHELKQQEELVEKCYARMEQGEAPSQEIEQEWLKMKNDEQRKMVMLMEKQWLEKEQTIEPGSLITTSEQRPNAYIPDDDNNLPLPKPYGKHAPFKPTELGSNMRHIRKPNPIAIDI